MGKNGGKRLGAGRKAGGHNKATLEQKKVLDAFNQRVMAKADVLFNAQLTLAVGSMKVFRVDEEESDGKKKRVHVHVTDADEIKALLDEHEGLNGIVEGVFYYFSEVAPDNKAIESMLNRALGKAPEKIEVKNVTDKREKLAEVLGVPLEQVPIDETGRRAS